MTTLADILKPEAVAEVLQMVKPRVYKEAEGLALYSTLYDMWRAHQPEVKPDIVITHKEPS